MLAAKQDREPNNVISSSRVMSLDVIAAFANGATQLSRSPTGSKPNGRLGLLPGKSKIAPFGHQATNEE
jgi:hypothetical protein